MSRVESERRPRLTFQKGTMEDVRELSKRLAAKGQPAYIPLGTAKAGRARELLAGEQSVVYLAIDLASGQAVGAMVGFIRSEGVVEGDFIFADKDFSEYIVSAALLRYAQRLPEVQTIILKAYPFHLRGENYAVIQEAVDKLKRHYSHLGFRPRYPKKLNDTEMIWGKSTNEQAEV